MDDLSAQSQVSPVLAELPRYQATGAEAAAVPRRAAWEIPRVNLVLFLLTLLTTTMAGADMAGAPVLFAHPFRSLINLSYGLSFSLPLMAILLAHEMGHYLTARANRVDTTLPYFIPAPWPSLFIIGTFGAFIRMKSPPRTRRAMFDIGAAGPWAGVIVAIVAVCIGLKLSQVSPLDTSSGGGFQLGNSILFWGLSRWMLGVDPNSVNVNLDPIAFAGWLGLFVTTLNLLPVGQLDGGHVTYALFGARWHRRISRLFALGLVLLVVVRWALGLDFWAGWLLWWLLIVLVLGLGHPSTVDADTPMSSGRRIAGWATIGLFIVTFSQVPISFEQPVAGEQQQQQQQQQDKSVSPWVMWHAPARDALHADALTGRA